MGVLAIIAGLALASASIYFVSQSVVSNVNSSECGLIGSDGSIFISSPVTVSIQICGHSYPVAAGIGGGFIFSYHSGPASFTAPTSVNGSQFAYWYAVLNTAAPLQLSNATITLNLPAGLSSQSSLLEVFYKTTQITATTSATSATSATTTTTSSMSTTSSTTTSTISVPGTRTTSSSTSSATQIASTNPCRGNDGSIFISTNIEAPAPITVCGEQLFVPGGTNGGISFSYHAGPINIVAPLTLDGKTFEYWSIVLPSGQGKQISAQTIIALPAGYSAGNALLVANYG
jgi:hypothetical protein